MKEYSSILHSWTLKVTAAQSSPTPCDGISQAKHWTGLLPFPSPWDLADPGIESRSPELQVNPLPTEPVSSKSVNILQANFFLNFY